MTSSESILLLLFFILLIQCKKEEKHIPNIVIENLNPSSNAIFDSANIPKHLREIVNEISGLNQYQDGVLAKGEEISYNFENFKKLKKEATNEELLLLLKNKNKVVALYAANALAENKFPRIEKIFAQLINLHQKINTQNGCVIGQRNLSLPFYEKYLYSVADGDFSADATLLKLDSVILFNPNSDKELIKNALANRLYTQKFRPRIEQLAFSYKNEDAVFYLCNWHRSDYNEKLQQTLKAMLNRDSLKSFQFQGYIKELVRFRNKQNNSFVIDILKKDTLWKEPETRFEMIWFLDRNGINFDD